MKLSDYTIPQQKAITSSGSNIIVSAGAGSGKTQVLTQRVLYFVKNEGYKLENFLILTFTNLAAGEMKERIRKTLLEEGLEEGNNVDIADITTFDAYALSLVKKYHYNLRVSPNISIVDSNVISVRKRTILNEIFESYYKANDQDFINMIKEFCFKDDNEIVDLTLSFYDKSMQKLDYFKYWDEFNNYYSKEKVFEYKSIFYELITKEIKNIQPLIDKLPDAYLKKGDCRIYQEVVYEMLEPLFMAKSYEELINLLNLDYTFPKMPNKSSESEKEANDSIKKAVAKLVKNYSLLPKNDDEFLLYLQRNILYANKIIEICKKLDLKVKEYKEIHEVYEFNDIAKMSLYLMKNFPEIRNEIKNRLKMIMIDEYQDTSIIQEEFISYIANNNVYMVGDVKQSIYRFRNARSDIFTNKYNKYKLGIDGIAIDLNKNFRSRTEVLDDINYIFKQIMTFECGGADYRKDHVIEYGNLNYLKAGDNKANNNLEFLIYLKDTSKKQAEVEAKMIATDIINKINSGYLVFDMINKKPVLRKCKFSDFCILMDRGTSFDTYLKVFNEYKIPIYAEQDENIKDNQITMIMTNILKLMKAIINNDYNNTEFRKAFISVARSFVFNYSDQRLFEIANNKEYLNNDIIKQFKDIIYQNSHLSIAELFEEIIYQLDIYYKLISIGNVRKNELYINTFIELFKNMSKLDYSLDDFILYMSYINEYDMKITLSSQSQDIDSVRIMNIHKSKGLEFNITYFSGLTAGFNQMEMKQNFGVSDKYGMIFPPHNLSGVNILKELNIKHEKQEDLSEKIRLFYVALTRAREKMIFLYPLEEDEYELYSKSSNNEPNSDIINKIKDKFELYKKDSLTLDEFVSFIDGYNYELSKEFSVLDPLMQKEVTDINFVIVDKGESNIDLSTVTSFKGFLDLVYNYNKFKKYTVDYEEVIYLKDLDASNVIYQDLVVENVDIKSSKIDSYRASKKLDLTSKKESLEFGNKLHLLMEVIEFKNPDYSLIDNILHKEIIQRFLSTDLLKNVSDANVYKEYQFYDEKEKLSGIIDLMIVYDTYIDIIDYKTKNIADDGYIEQLNSYRKYIKNVFGKPINCYLYSLLTGEVKKI